MATIQNQNDENQPVTGGTSAAGGATAQTSAGTAGQQPVSPVQQNVAPTNNAGYTDVSSYLNANQQGGANLGNQVASNLTNQYNTTKSGIDTSVNAANQSINSGYIPENSQLIQQVANNPTAAANDQSQLTGFQNQLNDTYGGPTSYEDYGTQQGNVANAQQYGNLLNTPGGNNVLIQQVENQNQPGHISAGINALDTLLFSGNSGAVNTAQTAAQPFSTLNSYLDTQNTGINNNIAGAQNNAAQASQDALNAFTGQNGTLTNLNNTVNTTAANDLTQAQQQEAALKADIANLYGGQALDTTGTTITGYGGSQNPWYNTTNYTTGNLSPQDLASLGITQDQWAALQSQLQGAGTAQKFAGYNGQFGEMSPTTQIDIGQYLQQQDPASMINAGTVGTADQYAETAAINKLLGGQAPTQGEALNPLNSALAGTYNPANLNQFDYTDALGSATSTNAAEKTAAQQEANALTGAADVGHAASQHGGGFLGGLKQAITHPGDLLGSISNPASWIPNLENISKGQTISPTNMNPSSPTTNNLATPIINKIPQVNLANKAGQKIGIQGAAHGGEIKDIDEFLNKVGK